MSTTKENRLERLAKMEAFKLYTLSELEDILGVTHRTLLEYVKKGKLKARKIGGKWRVTEQNLKLFINGEE